MILNYMWKYISGWSNYSGKVISHVINESIMGNRGSKCDKAHALPLKEQRVDGSWYGSGAPYLRCTLMGNENYYQVRILSNLKSNLRNFSSTANHTIAKLSPEFVTGFTDAEGTFGIPLTKREDKNISWQVRLEFKIELHVQDLELLYKIKKFFNDKGSINISKTRNTARFRITSLEDILNYVIPHFDNYPMHTQKQGDFLLFRKAGMLMKNKKHLNPNGLQEIINIKATSNLGLNNTIKESFPNTSPVVRPVVVPRDISPYWMAGFVSGDGGFNIALGRVRVGSNRRGIRLFFIITQHVKDTRLINSFKEYFNCGGFISSKNAIVYRVTDQVSVSKVIIPFFTKYNVQGKKYDDFTNWVKISNLIDNKEHLTQSGYEKIINIKGLMNKSRLKEFKS